MGKPKNPKYNAVIEMYQGGMRVKEIADYYSVTYSVMWRILQRRGIVFGSKWKYGKDNHFYRGGIRSSDHAQNIVEYAIKSKKLIPQPCEICGVRNVFEKDGRRTVQAHHDDYNEPLKVRWLCRKHHYDWHKKNKPKEIIRKVS